jgi:hypothetical protein
MVDPQHSTATRFMPAKYRASELRLRMQALKRAMQRTVYRATRRRPESVAHRWITSVPDLTECEACLFVSYSPDGTLSDQARFHLQAWATQGFAVVLILCTDKPVAYVPGDEVAFCAGVLVRFNEGYDFAGWASGVALLPTLKSARSMVMVNDSIYGPTDRFAAMVARLRDHPADLCGAVESMQFRPHVQSFLVRFGPRLLRSRAFAQFWRGVRIGDRKFVIRTCELEMARVMGQAGFTIDVLYHTSDEDNPTLTSWRELIDMGFPYVKAQLLRDNPCNVDLSEWRELLITQGYDPTLIDQHRPGATDAADRKRNFHA